MFIDGVDRLGVLAASPLGLKVLSLYFDYQRTLANEDGGGLVATATPSFVFEHLAALVIGGGQPRAALGALFRAGVLAFRPQTAPARCADAPGNGGRWRRRGHAQASAPVGAAAAAGVTLGPLKAVGGAALGS